MSLAIDWLRKSHHTTSPGKGLTAALLDRRPNSPAQTLKSKSSSRLLRLTRREPKNVAPEIKTVAPAAEFSIHSSGKKPANGDLLGPESRPQSSWKDLAKKDSSRKAVAGYASSNCKGNGKSVPMSSCFPTSERSVKATSSTQYNCIICKEALSSKGVCKRHLEDQHVLPTLYKCERCEERFDIKSVANTHVAECGKGVLFWNKVKMDPKKLYACEYTGKSFSSVSKYLEHLLDLSQKGKDRPHASRHLKLYALLDQANLRQHVDDISNRLHGSRDAWRTLRWADMPLAKAINQLEHAVVHENCVIDFGKHSKTQNTREYLNDLLRAGTTSRPNSSQQSVGESKQPDRPKSQRRLSSSSSATNRTTTTTPTTIQAPMPQLPTRQSNCSQNSIVMSNAPAMNMVTHIEPIDQEVKGKRHLSDHSRFYVPSREPPGPPCLPLSYPYPLDTHVQDPRESTASTLVGTPLPYKYQEGLPMTQPSSTPELSQMQVLDLSAPASVVSSDTASETTQSTLVSNYREPELQNSVAFNLNLWSPEGSLYYNPVSFHDIPNYALPNTSYYPSGDMSVRTSSVATDHTYVGYNGDDQKLADFGPLLTNEGAQFGTFLLDDEQSPPAWYSGEYTAS